MQDQNAKPLANAKVTIADRFGKSVFTGSTDDRGVVGAVLTEYVQTPKGQNRQTPHSVAVGLQGYEPLTKSIEVRGKSTLRVTLSAK